MTFEQDILTGDMVHPNETTSSYSSSIIDTSNTTRLKRITERQEKSSSALTRLFAIIKQLEEKFEVYTIDEITPKEPAYISDHTYVLSNTSSGVSSATSETSETSPTSTPPSSINKKQRFNRYSKLSAKRRIIYDELEYDEFSAEQSISQEQESISQEEPEYPQQFGDLVTLGPNGTQIDMRSYSSIIWSSAASATRQLLGFVFTSDVLATHTLTGKPSPAFYGRERPAKMQLDPIKAADIIHCVRSKFKCTEREIRAAITTKCSDTSKKYKRRSQKQQESSKKCKS